MLSFRQFLEHEARSHLRIYSLWLLPQGMDTWCWELSSLRMTYTGTMCPFSAVQIDTNASSTKRHVRAYFLESQLVGSIYLPSQNKAKKCLNWKWPPNSLLFFPFPQTLFPVSMWMHFNSIFCLQHYLLREIHYLLFQLALFFIAFPPAWVS